MNARCALAVWVGVVGFEVSAAVLPPEQVLPPDTLAVLAVPDYAATKVALSNEPMAQLWSDPALQPFRAKLSAKLKQELVGPLEETLRLRLAEEEPLFRGALAAAVVRNGWEGRGDRRPAWLLLADTRDQSAQLGLRLVAWRKRWADAGRTLASEKIADCEFSQVPIATNLLASVLPLPGAVSTNQASTNSTALWVGQSASWLLVGNNRQVLEGVIRRQTGGTGPALRDQADFAADLTRALNGTSAYGWIHVRPLVEILQRLAQEREAAQGTTAILQPAKLLAISGLADLKTVAFGLRSSPDGSLAEVRLGLPAAERAGLFRLLSPEPKDAGPPAFVSAEVTRFQRLRLDLPTAWTNLENMVFALLPPARGVMEFMVQNLGKDKDPQYNLRAELIGNLGDDVLFVEHRPRTNSLAGLSSPPSLMLIGTRSPDRLVTAVKTITALLPAPMNDVQERDLAGIKVYGLPLPTAPQADGRPGAPREFAFAATNGYLALTTENHLLEAFVREASGATNALRDQPDLTQAAQKVGGFNTGWFGYEHDRETMGALLEALKTDAPAINQMFAMFPLGAASEDDLAEWLDFSLLPPFEKIARYFHFSVYGAAAQPDGMNFRMFSPTPPELMRARP
jgi:hypothetical protein